MLTRSNATWIAGKSALSCALALLLCRWTGVPDLVTSTFVAVLCVSPTVLIGARRSAAQFVGSMVGGLFGTGMLLRGLPLEVGIPAAVGASILVSIWAGLPGGYPIAAFTALFVQAVPRGSPWVTFGVRLEAVAIAAIAATVVNILVSALAYRSIFDKRLCRAQKMVRSLLRVAVDGGPTALTPGFVALSGLEVELRLAEEELRWRRAARTLARVREVRERVAALQHLLHIVQDIRLSSKTEARDFLCSLATGSTPRGLVPGLESSCRRAEALAVAGFAPLEGAC